jgi:hypothetical protein
LYGLVIQYLLTIGFYLCILPGIYLYNSFYNWITNCFFGNKTPMEKFKKALNITNDDFGHF